MSENNVIANPWQALRQFTDARIALGRAGVSQPTEAQLAFQLAHAQARDAVHLALDAPRLAQALETGLGLAEGACLRLHSAAADRHVYLQRPDLGRRLDAASCQALQALQAVQASGGPASGTVSGAAAGAAAAGPVQDGAGRRHDLALVLADGLSALAIEQNALPFLQALLPRIAREGWSLAPLAIVEQSRVAVGDEVGELLRARMVVVLVGERPGLSSPDSMGLYLTWGPRTGLSDESRNCISNVRPAGLGYAEAAARLHYLLGEAFRRGLSGVALKDESDEVAGEGAPALGADGGRKFLL